MAIIFTSSDIEYKLTSPQKVKNWIKSIITLEGKRVGDISVVWCSDEFLLGINRQFLSHDYFTDIITFDYCEGDLVSGDLLISLDTVRSNSSEYNVMFHVEQLRVVAHGILHLCGYGDKSDNEVVIMRDKENFYMSKFDGDLK